MLRENPSTSLLYTKRKTCAVLPDACHVFFTHRTSTINRLVQHKVMWSAGQGGGVKGETVVDTPFSHFLIIFWFIVMTSQYWRNTCVLSTGCVTLRCPFYNSSKVIRSSVVLFVTRFLTSQNDSHSIKYIRFPCFRGVSVNMKTAQSVGSKVLQFYVQAE